jgi:hypothetical protein
MALALLLLLLSHSANVGLASPRVLLQASLLPQTGREARVDGRGDAGSTVLQLLKAMNAVASGKLQ